MFGNLWRKRKAASKARKSQRDAERTPEEREQRIKELREFALEDLVLQKKRLRSESE